MRAGWAQVLVRGMFRPSWEGKPWSSGSAPVSSLDYPTGLAQQKQDVAIASRKLDNGEAAAREIESATGRRAVPLECHVGRWEDCDRLVESVCRKLGRCDVLVNNAEMSPTYDGLTSVTEDLYDKVHAINARGPFERVIRRTHGTHGPHRALAEGDQGTHRGNEPDAADGDI